LTTAFFRLLAERMADSLVVVTARENGRLVAAALNLRDDEALYGRLWGSLESHRFLHFELCYYRALEFAIAGGLARVEAGAQGEHKLLRGYEPVWTWSAHHIRNAGLAAAVARFLRHETRLLGHRFAELERLLPYRRSAQDDSRMASSGRKEK
ncbi:MAG TPA: GNAT family N-acetyltransferase, partial [Rhodospirillales bacterium]|nr:GNAT family N-acetyltransferase [Rhodospirillales bacterium]